MKTQPLTPPEHPAPASLPPVAPRTPLRIITRRALRAQFVAVFCGGALVGSLGTALHLLGSCNDALRAASAANARAIAAEAHAAAAWDDRAAAAAAAVEAARQIEAIKTERREALRDGCHALTPADRARYTACVSL